VEKRGRCCGGGASIIIIIIIIHVTHGNFVAGSIVGSKKVLSGWVLTGLGSWGCSLPIAKQRNSLPWL